MIKLSSLQNFLDNYLNFDKSLNIAKIDPYMANGLMVRGVENVEKIGFSVSASIALFEMAKKEKCQAVVVHHAFNLPPFNRYDFLFQNRFSYLTSNNISLFGYHFLLDAHPEVGNNVEILKTIGAKPVKPYLHRGSPWGFIGEFSQSRDLTKIKEDISPFLSSRSVVYDVGPQKVRRVAAVSGKGAPIASDMQYLVDDKIDLFITGEVHEWNRELFAEADINFLAGGHYSTEKFGVQALMARVKKHFRELEVDWLELSNEV